MGEDIPWTFTELGEDSFEEREARRELQDTREYQLYGQGIDGRLISFVWGCPPALLDVLVVHDLTDVGWLDQLAVEDPGVVPLLSLGLLERGIGARSGDLVVMEDHGEVQVDLEWVWEQVFAPGLERLVAALSANEAVPDELFDDGVLKRGELMQQFALLGGLELMAFAEGLVAQDMRTGG